MSISSSSSLAEITAAYIDNASYDVDRDVTKCKAFVTACRVLKMKLAMAAESGTRESHLKVAPEQIDGDLKQALEWLVANDTGNNGAGGPSAVKANFNNSRL